MIEAASGDSCAGKMGAAVVVAMTSAVTTTGNSESVTGTAKLRGGTEELIGMGDGSVVTGAETVTGRGEVAVTLLGSENFSDFLRSKRRVLIEFSAPWCTTCHRFETVFVRAAKRHPDVSFASVNVDKNQELCRRLGITQIPTVISFIDTYPVDRRSGVIQGAVLDAMLSQDRLHGAS